MFRSVPDTSIRRKVATLIAARAVVGTVLLGSGTISEIKAPGSFPIDPFFLLAAVTYALTIVWAATLPIVDRAAWAIDPGNHLRWIFTLRG